MSEALLKSNATDEQTRSALQKFENIFGSYENHITTLVKAKGLDPRNFMVTVINSFKRNPTLLECEISTVLGAVLASAELGLEPNTPFQLSHIIPYNNNKAPKGKPAVWVKEAQFQIGYQGWIELFQRHEKIESWDFAVVYENEEFKQIKGSKPDLIHVPIEDPEKRGSRKGAYAIAWLTGNDLPTWAYVSKSDIDVIKTKSRGSDSEYSPWHEKNDPMGWMWMKVAIKQLAKKLPKTREIELSIYAEDAVETGKALKADPENKTIQLDPVESQEERNQNKAAEQSRNVAESTASMFNKPKEENESQPPVQEPTEKKTESLKDDQSIPIEEENDRPRVSDKPESNGSGSKKPDGNSGTPESNLPERRKKAIYHFISLGINKERLLHHLELDNEDEISMDHLIMLEDIVKEASRKGGRSINELIPPVKSN